MGSKTQGFNDAETLVLRLDLSAPREMRDRVRRSALINNIEDCFAGWEMFPAPDHGTDDMKWEPSQGYEVEVAWPDLYGAQTVAEDCYPVGTEVLASEGDYSGIVWRKLAQDLWEPVNPALRETWGPQKLESLVQDGLGIVLHWQESR